MFPFRHVLSVCPDSYPNPTDGLPPEGAETMKEAA